MKEIIGAVILIVGIYGGTSAVHSIHQMIKQEALKKASKGLPSLRKMRKGLSK